jgi:hypothetical protein
MRWCHAGTGDAYTDTMGETTRIRRARGALPIAIITLISGLVVLGLVTWPRQTNVATSSPAPSVIVGIPGGEVIPDPTPVPSPSPGAVPTTAPVEATPEPTAEPSVAVTPEPTPEQTPVPTPAPVAAATPPPTAQPTTVVVALAGPADTVSAFYAYVVDGAFDEAYALWSDRMRATYPREANLDNRFDETASIAFQELAVVEQGPASATVQANFTETADGGSSQEFIGYWRLVQVDGRWLLDEPHY